MKSGIVDPSRVSISGDRSIVSLRSLKLWQSLFPELSV